MYATQIRLFFKLTGLGAVARTHQVQIEASVGPSMLCINSGGFVIISFVTAIWLNYISRWNTSREQTLRSSCLILNLRSWSSADCCMHLFSYRPRCIQCESKKVAQLKLFAIFPLNLSKFLWNFANLLPIYIHAYLPIKYLTTWR